MWLVRGLPKKCGSGAVDEVEGLHRVVLCCCSTTQTCRNARGCSGSRVGCEWLTRGWVAQGMCGLVGFVSRGRAGRGSGVHLAGERQLSTPKEQSLIRTRKTVETPSSQGGATPAWTA